MDIRYYEMDTKKFTLYSYAHYSYPLCNKTSNIIVSMIVMALILWYMNN